MKSDTLYFQSSFNRPNIFYEVKEKLKNDEFINDIYETIVS